MKTIDIVIPAYNEEGNIELLCEKIFAIKPKTYQFRIILVNDGSTDATLAKIRALSLRNRMVKFISFSRNFGHQVALKAGLDHSTGGCAISLDADLQHPPELIPTLIGYWEQGYDIVYTRRTEAKHIGFFKRKSANIFYYMLQKLSGLKIDPGAADFRLLDRSVVDTLRQYQEQNLFIRGMISNIGFRTKAVEYTPDVRHSGKSKYTFRKMFLFALDGITSFSVKPLHLATIFGFVFSSLAGLYAAYAVYIHFTGVTTVSGWTSIMVSVLFVGGIQLIMLGILGEYLGKMFMQTKNRPNYIIQSTNIKR